ncbi:MAG: haloacid dehalogenase-like hydrolase [Fibrobacter sp.]|nr:haloacid dehalogenase-like hydrolase [Fibrobacter sp.]
MANSAFEQNIVAMVWDCDKTLISSYMQEPLFRHYNVDGAKFWAEVNALKDRYGTQGISVNADTSYLNHILTYVKAGIFKGLNNRLLHEFGKELKFYPGLPDFFGEVKKLIEEDPKYKAFDIRLEHYVVSTGFAETIKGSAIAPYVDGIFGCEFIEDVLMPGFLDEAAPAMSASGCEISQVACALDNTSKTRYLFEINKGSNKYPETIDVNSSIARSSRRVPFENMVYIADGPSDVPAFSILNYNGGGTFAVYPKGDPKGMRQVEALRCDGRVQMYGEADYTKASLSWMWLTEKARSIADKIVAAKQDAIKNSAGAPPTHLG